MFITVVIDASKNRDVMIIGNPGMFLHAPKKDKVDVLLRGPLSETIVLIDPECYLPHVTHGKKGVPMLYIKMNKELYG